MDSLADHNPDTGNNPRIVLFAHDVVGAAIADFVLREYRDDIVAVVLAEAVGPVTEVLDRHGLAPEMRLLWDPATVPAELARLRPDDLLLVWWPHILRAPLLSLPARALLNTHPSLLPHNRGKHPNFWSLVEGRPFGVTIHHVNNSVDGGDIAFQMPMQTTWEDTGGTLYHKARDAMIRLFIDSYSEIRAGSIPRQSQTLSSGSFHLGQELESACVIDLDRQYTARELLNIIRARTFPPYPGVKFTDGTAQYQVRISIERVDE
jgi:methionyl-tRNA formyltransferase